MNAIPLASKSALFTQPVSHFPLPSLVPSLLLPPPSPSLPPSLPLSLPPFLLPPFLPPSLLPSHTLALWQQVPLASRLVRHHYRHHHLTDISHITSRPWMSTCPTFPLKTTLKWVQFGGIKGFMYPMTTLRSGSSFLKGMCTCPHQARAHNTRCSSHRLSPPLHSSHMTATPPKVLPHCFLPRHS